MFTALLKAVGFYVSPAEKSVRACFRAANPESRVAWSTVKEEAGRFVVGVFFGTTLPPRSKFYAVAKNGFVAAPLKDDSGYAPKYWR